MMKDLVLKNRSYRRFYQSEAVDEKTLRELVDLARCSASAANRQPLKYILSCDPEKNALIFPLIGFAAQLRDWGGPFEGERPAAYIIILLDTEIAKQAGCDHGIAAQSILLGATERGLGGCMHGSAKKTEMMKALNIPERYEILLVISLGKPKEKVVLETVGPDGKTAYWRDKDQTHHVPKRTLDEVIIG
jgi:nitroreductase